MASQTDDTTVISLRLPRGDYEQLKAVAAKDHRTASAEIRRLIEIRVSEVAA